MFELKGKLTYMVGFTAEGHPIVTFEMNDKVQTLQMVDALHNEDELTIRVLKSTKKRSLDANSYYWTLLTKLSAKLNVSNNYCHNLMLRRYGVVEDFDGQVAYLVIPDTEEAAKKADEAETFHIKPTSQVKEGNDGIMWRTYIKLKGSHDYTREEFSRLVNGLVDECKAVGIPTETPDELLRMMSLYKEH